MFGYSVAGKAQREGFSTVPHCNWRSFQCQLFLVGLYKQYYTLYNFLHLVLCLLNSVFLSCDKTSPKFTIFKWALCSSTHIHILIQPSPPPITWTFSSSQNLTFLNSCLLSANTLPNIKSHSCNSYEMHKTIILKDGAYIGLFNFLLWCLFTLVLHTFPLLNAWLTLFFLYFSFNTIELNMCRELLGIHKSILQNVGGKWN